MKLRLKGNTLRLRLLEPEVRQIAQGETVTETLPTQQPFHFQIAAHDLGEVEVRFAGDTLTVSVPKAWASTWAHNSETGRRDFVGGIDVLIEKDWACTTARAEDNAGTYPNPTKT
jgi:hypothetical protein